MKSEKAEKCIEWHIDHAGMYDELLLVVSRKVAIEAVELAENEMRERAFEGFKLSCEKYDKFIKRCFSGYRCEDTCCGKRDSFLYALDNLKTEQHDPRKD